MASVTSRSTVHMHLSLYVPYWPETLEAHRARHSTERYHRCIEGLNLKNTCLFGSVYPQDLDPHRGAELGA